MQSTLKTEFIASIRGWGEGLRETYKIPACGSGRTLALSQEIGTSERWVRLGERMNFVLNK